MTDAPSSPSPGSPPIASPCILVCSIEPGTGYCWGCGRTTREIGAWTLYDDAQREAVMQALPARLAALPERRERRRTRRRAAARDPGGAGTDSNGTVSNGTDRSAAGGNGAGRA